MPGLYGLSSNANVAVSNTTGLYINSGASPILNNAQQLLALLSNNGTVIFALDPATGYSKVEAFATGSGGGSGNLIINLTGDVTAFGSTGNATPTTLSNTGVTAGTYGSGNRYFPRITIDSKGRITSATTQDVAAFLPSYAGQLAAIQPASIVTQGTGGITTFGNLAANNASITSKLSAATITITQGIFWANGAPVFNYSNANVAAYLPTYQGNIGSIKLGNISTGNLYVDNIFATGNITYSNVNTIVTNVGTIYANANVPSTSPNTGAIISAGGLGVNGNLFVGEILNIPNTGDVSANIGAYQIFANANAATQTTEINSLRSNITAANAQISTLSANIGSYQIFANANAATQQTQINNLVTQANANTAAYLLGNTQQGNIRANTINLGPFGNFLGNPNYSGVLNIQGGTGFLGYGANLTLTSNLGTDAAGYAYATIGSTVNNQAGGQFATGTPAQTILTGNILIPQRAYFGPNAFINNTLLTPTNNPVGVFEGNVYFNFYSATPNNAVNFYNRVNIIGSNANLTLGTLSNINVNGGGSIYVTPSGGSGGNIFVGTGGYYLGDGSKLSNIVSSYGNANVTALLGAGTQNIVAATLTLPSSYVYARSFIPQVEANNALFTTTLTQTSPGYQVQLPSSAATAYYLPSWNGNANLIPGTTFTFLNQSANTASVAGTNGLGAQYSIPASSAVDFIYVANVLNSSSNIKNWEYHYRVPTNATWSNTQLTYPGTINAGFFVGDGSGLTNVGGYGNANVAAYLLTNTGNIAAGNIFSNNYLYANGISILTGIGGTYSNTNVAAYLPTDPTITNIQANIGAYQTFANANAASQQTQINSLSSSLSTTIGQLETLDANVGAFETYANTTFATTGGLYSNANVASYLPTYSGDLNSVDNIIAQQISTPNTITTEGIQYNQYPSTTFIKFVNVGSTTGYVSLRSAGTISAKAPANDFWGTSETRMTSGTGGVYNTVFDVDAAGEPRQTVYGNLIQVNSSITYANLANVITSKGIFWANGVNYSSTITGTYGNTQVAAYLPTDPTFTGYLTFANANAATQTTAINAINANLGAYQTYGNLTFSTVANAAAQQTQIDTNTAGIATLNANLGAYQTYANTQIQNLNANLGGFETWANINLNYYTNTNAAAFLASMGANNISTTGNVSAYNITATNLVTTPQIESLTSLDINSPAEVNVNANLRVGDNGVATQISTHGTGDLILRTHNGDANQGNIRLYNGTNGNIDVRTNGTGTINLRGAVNTTDGIVATGNITASYVTANASKMTSLTGVSAGTYGSDTTIPTIVVDATGRITQITTNAISGGGSYGNANVAAYLAGTITVGNILSTDGYYWANGAPYSTGGGSTYGNTQVAAYLPTDPTFTGYLTFANANAASQQTSIDSINANIGAYQTYANTQIQTVNANLGAFQTYANVTFSTVANAASQQTQIDGIVNGTTTLANVKSTGGYFWANGTPYSTGGSGGVTQIIAGGNITIDPAGGTGVVTITANALVGPAGPAFSGNLAGNILYDSVNERVIANAFPLSTANVSVPGNSTARFIVHDPVYTNNQLQQPPLANATTGGTSIIANGQSAQSIGMVQSANIALQSGYGFGAQNRDTVNFFSTLAVTPVTANSMSTNDRVRGGVFTVDYVSGPNSIGWGTMGTGSQNASPLAGLNAFVNINGSGNVGGVVGGNYGVQITPPATGTAANIQYSTGLLAFTNLFNTASNNAKANVVYSRGIAPFVTGFSSNLTVQYAVGLHTYSGWAGSGSVGTANNPILGRFALLNEDTNTTIRTNGPVIVSNASATFSGNVECSNQFNGGFLKFASYTAAGLTAYTGTTGQVASVSDQGGKLAYWDTTNTRWSYVHDNSAV